MHPRLPEEVREFARRLRANQTNAESLLWLLLRNRRLGGFKFRRQDPLGPYTLDFHCKETALAVELDGGQHNSDAGVAADHRRTQWLEKQGVLVIRFWNHEILLETEAVLEKIYEQLLNRASKQ